MLSEQATTANKEQHTIMTITVVLLSGSLFPDPPLAAVVMVVVVVVVMVVVVLEVDASIWPWVQFVPLPAVQPVFVELLSLVELLSSVPLLSLVASSRRRL